MCHDFVRPNVKSQLQGTNWGVVRGEKPNVGNIDSNVLICLETELKAINDNAHWVSIMLLFDCFVPSANGCFSSAFSL